MKKKYVLGPRRGESCGIILCIREKGELGEGDEELCSTILFK
jgi:hypothetical protein